MEFPEEEASEPEHTGSARSASRSNERQSKSSKSLRLQKRATADKRCSSCGTTTTPVWRWGGEAKETLLCNACSLRIRRSTGRPNRAKSPGDRVVKRNHVSSMTSSDSGGQQANSDVLSHDQVTVDNHVFQARLQDLVSKERDRLLGIPSSMPVDDIWPDLQWPGSEITAPSTPRPPDWEPFPSLQQYSYDGLSDTGRLDFGPSTPNLTSLDQGIVEEIFS